MQQVVLLLLAIIALHDEEKNFYVASGRISIKLLLRRTLIRSEVDGANYLNHDFKVQGEKVKSFSSFSIFPNPGSGFLYIFIINPFTA